MDEITEPPFRSQCHVRKKAVRRDRFPSPASCSSGFRAAPGRRGGWRSIGIGREVIDPRRCYPYYIEVLPLLHGPCKSLRNNAPKVYNRGTGYRFLFHRQPGTGKFPGCLRKKAVRRDRFPSPASCSSGFRAAPGRGMHVATARLRASRAGVFGAFTGASSTRVGEFDNVGTNGKNDVAVEGKVTRVRVVADVGQCQATALDSAAFRCSRLGGDCRASPRGSAEA